MEIEAARGGIGSAKSNPVLVLAPEQPRLVDSGWATYGRLQWVAEMGDGDGWWRWVVEVSGGGGWWRWAVEVGGLKEEDVTVSSPPGGYGSADVTSIQSPAHTHTGVPSWTTPLTLNRR